MVLKFWKTDMSTTRRSQPLNHSSDIYPRNFFEHKNANYTITKINKVNLWELSVLSKSSFKKKKGKHLPRTRWTTLGMLLSPCLLQHWFGSPNACAHSSGVSEWVKKPHPSSKMACPPPDVIMTLNTGACPYSPGVSVNNLALIQDDEPLHRHNNP